MAQYALTSRLPWQDRWSKPTLQQLLDPLQEQHRPLVDQLMENIAAFDQLDQTIVWFGAAWNWTIQYEVTGLEGPISHGPEHTLIYLVPNAQSPVVSIPLTAALIDQLPLKRLNRYIRDGIKTAKHGVEVYWAAWTPSSATEVGHLSDLIKRKYKLLTGKKGAEIEADLPDLEDESEGLDSATAVKPKAKRGRKPKVKPVDTTASQAEATAPVVADPISSKKPKKTTGRSAKVTTKSASVDQKPVAASATQAKVALVSAKPEKKIKTAVTKKVTAKAASKPVKASTASAKKTAKVVKPVAKSASPKKQAGAKKPAPIAKKGVGRPVGRPKSTTAKVSVKAAKPAKSAKPTKPAVSARKAVKTARPVASKKKAVASAASKSRGRKKNG